MKMKSRTPKIIIALHTRIIKKERCYSWAKSFGTFKSQGLS
jgi:hypothetical protein